MKVASLFLILLTGLFFFNGCSTKKYYEPANVKDDWAKQDSLNEIIIDLASNVAVLENNKILTNTKIIDFKLLDGYHLISQSDTWIISATTSGMLEIQNTEDLESIKIFDLKKTIAAASIYEDTLAILFADNEMALYSISTKKLFFKEQGEKTIAIDSHIMNPHFLNRIVIFLTLDGKVVVINTDSKKKLRSSIVSSENHFNNIIYFAIVENKVIAATKNTILSMSQDEIRKKYEVRNLAHDNKNIYITTKYGEIVSLTSSLELNAKLKFPFAHFLGLIIHNDTLYALEKAGYLIVAPLNLDSYEVYDVDIDDGFVFVGDTKFYINEDVITLD